MDYKSEMLLTQILEELKSINKKLDAVTPSDESKTIDEDCLKWMKDNPPKAI